MHNISNEEGQTPRHGTHTRRRTPDTRHQPAPNTGQWEALPTHPLSPTQLNSMRAPVSPILPDAVQMTLPACPMWLLGRLQPLSTFPLEQGSANQCSCAPEGVRTQKKKKKGQFIHSFLFHILSRPSYLTRCRGSKLALLHRVNQTQ